jgi:hypothetical protein
MSLLPAKPLPSGAAAPPLSVTTNDDNYNYWSLERAFVRPWILHAPGYGAESLAPGDNVPNHGYGRDLSAFEGMAALSLCLNTYTTQQKLPLTINLTQVGIDLYQYVKDGANEYWYGDGGHNSGRKFPILFAGYMLNDSGMLGIGSLTNFHFQEDDQTFYVDAANVGRYFADTDNCMGSQWSSSNFPPAVQNGTHLYGFNAYQVGIEHTQAGDVEHCYTTPPDMNSYTTEHIGMPEWGIRHAASDGLKSDRLWIGGYRGVNSYSWPGIALATHILNLKDKWNHDAFFDYMDRWMNLTAVGGDWHSAVEQRSIDTFSEKMWDTYRANYDNKKVKERKGSTLTFRVDVNDPNIKPL